MLFRSNTNTPGSQAGRPLRRGPLKNVLFSRHRASHEESITRSCGAGISPVEPTVPKKLGVPPAQTTENLPWGVRVRLLCGLRDLREPCGYGLLAHYGRTRSPTQSRRGRTQGRPQLPLGPVGAPFAVELGAKVDLGCDFSCRPCRNSRPPAVRRATLDLLCAASVAKVNLC